MSICSKCGGKGYLEYQAGLIRLRCENCLGKGEIIDEVSIIEQDKPKRRIIRKEKSKKR
jgi:DnaJ-class molecular chaperone